VVDIRPVPVEIYRMPSCLYESNGGTIISMEDPTVKKDEAPSSLTYEETPIIHPVDDHVGGVPMSQDIKEMDDDPASVVPEAAQVFGSQPSVELPRVAPEAHHAVASPSSVPPRRSKKFHMGTILFIGLLFALGVWLSSQLRSFFAPTVSQETIVPTTSPLQDAAVSPAPLASSSAVLPVSGWQTYDVVSGATKKPIAGISYQLPNIAVAPTCDSASCASQGTNLPGGTRFTVAPRGKGQLLPDFRGAILTDAAGREFTMKQTMIGTQYVYEYVGDFTGRTGG